jgi:Glycosyl transferase family 2
MRALVHVDLSQADGRLLAVAAGIAAAPQATVDLLAVVDNAGERPTSACLGSVRSARARLEELLAGRLRHAGEARVVVAEGTAEGVRSGARGGGYDLVVLERGPDGPDPNALLGALPCSLLLVCADAGHPGREASWLRLAAGASTQPAIRGIVVAALAAAGAPPPVEARPPESPTSDPPPDVSRRIDTWFAERTYGWEEFADLAALVRRKERRRATVCLVLPALNEERTIGRVVSVLKRGLVERVGLVDELAVVDSDSTDRTAEIARDHGVRVFRHADVLPSLGTLAGKGEALWKSLFELSGDIVAWCDTDIVNVHEGFVAGVVGPLLADRRLAYVKGFYRRPLATPAGIDEEGGGRVTELAARPLLNLLHPELAGFVQPLAGVCAARRSLLERLPFWAGYGMEVGHLIDGLEQVGLNGFAQTELGTVMHRNRSLRELSRMAFAIEHVMVQRFLRRRGWEAGESLPSSLLLARRGPAGEVHLDREAAVDRERPPPMSVPEYATRTRRS